MNEKKSSQTAEGMALVRAIESAKPAGLRICYDPVARKLVPGISFTLSKLVIDSGIYEKMSGGALGFITARERYIDDFLTRCLQEGITQVVILGAGFDTRASRIPGIEKANVIEIDHPATQAEKMKRMKKALGALPANVTYLPVDFNTRTLEEALLSPSSGYDPSARTAFLWQGVVVYLSEAGVDSTLAFIAHHSAPGSSVIFDYFYTETLQDLSRPEVRMMHNAAKVTGEGYLFGIPAGQVEDFLTRRGFTGVVNMTPAGLKKLYFHGPNEKRVLPDGCDIASARVK